MARSLEERLLFSMRGGSLTTLYNEQTSDADLVVAVQNGDRDAFSALYSRYFGRIYDFVARTLRNDADAAEVAQDVFVLVDTKVSQLREPAAFRGWIFAIARRQSLNRIRDRRKVQPMAPLSTDDRPLNPLLTAVDVSRIDDPVHAAAVQELAELVWEAAEALPEKQYMLLDLSVRQGLDSAEIAEVLGVTKGNAYTMLSRMRTRLGEQIGTYLLVRKGSKHCRELELLVANAEMPPVDDQLRKSVDRHVGECEECDEAKKRMLAPHQVLAALAAVPAPDGLADAIWESLPSNSGSRFGRRLRKWLIGAAVVVIGLGFGTVAADYFPPGAATTTSSGFALVGGDTTTSTTGVPVDTSTPVSTTDGAGVAEGSATPSTTATPLTTTTTV
ncbi:MAG TPA: sigma-70 family RNA polymerase sigma factor, partial [Actinobacteria bacterium]|nr:sigma-70 family RNA polymerase sigma factor [Actinomycetota bacterium]